LLNRDNNGARIVAGILKAQKLTRIWFLQEELPAESRRALLLLQEFFHRRDVFGTSTLTASWATSATRIFQPFPASQLLELLDFSSSPCGRVGYSTGRPLKNVEPKMLQVLHWILLAVIADPGMGRVKIGALLSKSSTVFTTLGS